MTAGENPFVSDTSSLQNQLKGSSFPLWFLFINPSEELINVEAVLLSFLFLISLYADKDLLAAKAEIEALRTNQELKDRAFGEVT